MPTGKATGTCAGHHVAGWAAYGEYVIQYNAGRMKGERRQIKASFLFFTLMQDDLDAAVLRLTRV
ncbi:hypothetical protein, partial [Komagataeibacter intermedius]|uniref:hypothetical protein n=1 Tax=Komagataeibacter intermedius TaxID=66229 RepID=UPI001AE06545